MKDGHGKTKYRGATARCDDIYRRRESSGTISSNGVAAGDKPAVPHVHTSSLDFGQAWRYAVGIYGGRFECIGIDRHTTPAVHRSCFNTCIIYWWRWERARVTSTWLRIVASETDKVEEPRRI